MGSNIRTRINKSAVGLFLFFIGYLVVAFFAKSAYPLNKYAFNFSVAFDVLHNAFSLTASLTAIVLAWIAYGSWREEHKAKAIEANAIEIYEKLRTISDFMLHVSTSIESDFKGNETRINSNLDSIMFEQLSRFNMISTKLNSYKPVTEEFCSALVDIEKYLRACFSNLLIMYATQNKITYPDKFNIEYLDYSNEQFIEDEQEKFDDYVDQWNDNQCVLLNSISELKPKLENLMIN